MTTSLSRPGYGKFVVELVAAGLAALTPALIDNVVDVGEGINIVILLLGAAGVIGAGNLPSGVWKYTKFWISVATAVATVVASVYTGGFTLSEYVQIAVAALAAAGVVYVPGPRVQYSGLAA